MQPPFLQKNDKVAIVATARKVSKPDLNFAIKTFKKWGLEVVLAPNIFEAENQFAGSDATRIESLQWALNDKSIKAIFIARGGYGTMRIIDELDFTKFKKYPKWIVGFSDITVLHSHINQNYKINTLHAPMPLTFNRDIQSLNYLKDVLFEKKISYEITSNNKLNKEGIAQAKIIGGNLSLIYALQGSKSDINTKNRVLFIEDLDEYLYHIDRMILSLKRSGKLSNLKALIVGSMIDMKDNTVPFGKTANEIIYEAVKEYDYPVVFDFPAGHDVKNYPLVFGKKAKLNVTQTNCTIEFLD